VTWPLTVRTESPEATRAVAAGLSRLCRSGDIILLIGDLGAGKTVFAQGFARGLGVEGPVTSPTFTLVRQYRCAGWAPVETLFHADVYRTGSLPEVADLALAELVEERGVALVEWGDLAAPALGDDLLRVTLEHPSDESDETREITFNGFGTWTTRADEVDGALSSSPAANAP
jgi:tRNA threonylcarbamoyladenosine biosynthesis protein TsaE